MSPSETVSSSFFLASYDTFTIAVFLRVDGGRPTFPFVASVFVIENVVGCEATGLNNLSCTDRTGDPDLGLKLKGLGGSGFMGGPPLPLFLSSRLGLMDLGLEPAELEREECADVLPTGGGGRALLGGPFLLTTGEALAEFDRLSPAGGAGRG